MPLKLYALVVSPYMQRVMMLLEELGIRDYEILPVNLLEGEHHGESFKAKNPFARIPVLVDEDDVMIYESRSILRYLANKLQAHRNLKGQSLKEAATVDMWMEVESNHYNPPLAGIAREKVFNPFFGRPVSEEAYVQSLKKLEDVLDTYEAVLSDGRSFIAGEQFSIADITHIPHTWLIRNTVGISEPFDKRPHVKAWVDRITSRPSWQKVQDLVAAAQA